jgi:hypothetical protein
MLSHYFSCDPFYLSLVRSRLTIHPCVTIVQGQRGYVVQSVDFLESMSQSDDALLLRANGSFSSQTPAINGDDDPVAHP